MARDFFNNDVQYYAFLNNYGAVHWKDPHGPFTNDMITLYLTQIIKLEKYVVETFDSTRKYTRAAENYIQQLSEFINYDIHKEEFLDSVLTFVLVSFLLGLSWIALRQFLSIVSTTFANIEPKHKQMYVVANLSKAFLLGIQVFSYSWWHYNYYVYYQRNPLLPIHTYVMKKVVVMYVVTDFVALILVPKLPISTKIHHYASTILMFAVLMTTFSHEENINVCHMINLYGMWSTLAFTTNLFLALRVTCQNSLGMRVLAFVSFAIYVVVCFSNWLTHLGWYAHSLYSSTVTVAGTVYMLAMSSLVNDDLVLMTWLFNYAVGKVGHPRQKPANEKGRETVTQKPSKKKIA